MTIKFVRQSFAVADNKLLTARRADVINNKMKMPFEQFLNIKYEGDRFSGGRLPLDVLADLQALEDILTTFAREIWLKKNARERMPSGYPDWFSMALKGVGVGSALPKLELSVFEEDQNQLLDVDTRRGLMQCAEVEFARVLRAASCGEEITLSPTQIRNFNRFLTNLKDGEKFKYSPDSEPITDESPNVILLDVERRKRFLTSVTATYEQRVQGKARLKNVDESGALRFVAADLSEGADLREFLVVDQSRPATDYGSNIGGYYEFDLTVIRRHDDSVQSVITIHELSLLDNPAIDMIDEMNNHNEGWLDGNGKEIEQSVRDIAKSFILTTEPLPSFYAVAPTEEGGILLEYEHNRWDYGIEFNSDGSFTFFGIELDGASEFSDNMPASNFLSLQERVKETLRIQ